jgi:2-polyprenyl-3-methyl-5-hydroxy-6-metoxy-1,4-benzoquinol methylase
LESYFRSVKATRLRAAEQLLERVKPFCPTGRWLDVGCSWGWLLTTAKEHGFQAEGIEPSAPAAAAASAAGHTIHHGLFPQALPHAARYHVISLMDVLEHLDDPVAALQAARAALEPRGVLVLQVPDRGCFLYRLAHWLHMASGGRCSFALARLWLLDFDFPHQTYFTRPALVRLLEQQGWQILEQWRSPLGRPTEALDRVRYTRSNQGLPITDALVALGVAGIQVLDNACGHGGLLNVLATPREAHPC